MADSRIIKHCAEGRDGDLILSPLTGMWSKSSVLTVDPSIAPVVFFDDFADFGVGATTGIWTLNNTNGTAVLGTADVNGLGGVVVLATGGVLAENYASIKVTTTDTGAPFMIVSNSGKKLWFEVRLYMSAAADESFYVGLFTDDVAQPGINDFGTENLGVAQDGIYFRTVNGTPTELDWACTKNGTEAEVKGNLDTWAATTWTRLGFYFDGVTSVVPYVDGVVSGSVMSTGLTDFPDDIGLTPLLYLKDGAGVAKEMWVDYIRVVQDR